MNFSSGLVSSNIQTKHTIQILHQEQPEGGRNFQTSWKVTKVTHVSSILVNIIYCLRIFRGHEMEVTSAFSRDFNGILEEIGYIKVKVIESFRAEAIEQPRRGENWFKCQ